MPILNPAPDEHAQRIIADLKAEFTSIETSIVAALPANRERALALTNLEQASMWATKAALEGTRN